MDAEVVIAGAGPNGLMLAIELRLAGVQPLVLERLPEPNSTPRANGLVGQVVRMLDRRGLYARLAGTPGPPQPQAAYIFGAMELPLAELEDNPVYLLPVPQVRVEAVLRERALELGAEIRPGHELSGLSQDADSVTVQVTGPDGVYELRTRYLVGADGGHSLTRKLAGIDFPGVTNDRTVSRTASALVPPELVDPETGALTIPGYGVIPPFMHHRTERGMFVFAPFPGRQAVSTAEWDDPADDVEMTFAELQASVDRVLGVHLPLTPPTGDGPRLLRRLEGGNSRLADRYREGRVLLVGDAAHVHSAMGGPGLNLGLQDAINLGWKLAAEVQGRAPAGLLDTYESERRPVGERVVMQTQAQTALVAPGNEVTALRELFGELLTEPRNVQRIAELITGADIRYYDGPHPLVGRWAPDFTVQDAAPSQAGVRLAELMRAARPLLLDLTPDGAFAATAVPDEVDVVTGLGERPIAMLIRPDGYVAWAAERDGAAEQDGLRDALAQWFQARPLTSATR
ncbi:2-polyprenyl-6-methoxyphenol hydroxylase-like FAD-dependent oxidoreductase [Kribbella rubisoli]|uniref:2-polyprenyl-6-methoxyphenol hydroxylase-like FAD-dependent oxidoreductase n=1 Tax=Kribbella rubisoli TaxID=3075929 RepID=A0A4Q7X9A3_9ACTN|nr:FAD-dependent monooxygenase [Kribbella rubisoli]RZU19634.1 2-polyprenyl-6-methoxyphenol hydroxylase-like FAD-dependent oxidoreductase [Kribbella rubisoli]